MTGWTFQVRTRSRRTQELPDDHRHPPWRVGATHDDFFTCRRMGAGVLRRYRRVKTGRLEASENRRRQGWTYPRSERVSTRLRRTTEGRDTEE